MVPARPQWTDQRIRHGAQGLLRPSDGSADSAGRIRLKTEGKPMVPARTQRTDRQIRPDGSAKDCVGSSDGSADPSGRTA